MSAVGFIVAHVRADAAFCVGAPEMEGASHLPVAVDPRTGAPVVPVSGLIGSLRAHAASVRPADADRLFGTIDGDSDGPSPSVVRGLGTVVTVNGAAVTAADVQERAQTAVDRRRGAAASSGRALAAKPPIRRACAISAPSTSM